MKPILSACMLCVLLASPALSELTPEDLDKIRLIVNESEKRVKEELKAELKAEIAKSEKNVKEYINIKMDSVEKRLSTYNWVIYVLMPLIVAAISIPTAIMAWRSRSERTLERRMEAMAQELETLKQQRIARP